MWLFLVLTIFWQNEFEHDAGKFPGHPGTQITHAYAIPCPSYLVLSLAYIPAPMSIIPTHLHPSEPINMLINNIYFQYHKFRLFIFSCFWIQNSIYMYLISQIDHYSGEQTVLWPFQRTIACCLTPSTSWERTVQPQVMLTLLQPYIVHILWMDGRENFPGHYCMFWMIW